MDSNLYKYRHHQWLQNTREQKKKYHTPEQLQKSNLKIGFIFLVIFCVLTPLSAIFQLYHGDQF
jgi:hypothetical protein